MLAICVLGVELSRHKNWGEGGLPTSPSLALEGSLYALRGDSTRATVGGGCARALLEGPQG